jgi:Putative F0F1-ATPase subunit Ca2+/Mg2+ transporter
LQILDWQNLRTLCYFSQAAGDRLIRSTEGPRVTDNDPDPSLRARDLVGLGSLLLGCLLVGLAVGWLVDDRLGAAPVFTLLGLAIGVAAGIWVSWLRIRLFLRS